MDPYQPLIAGLREQVEIEVALLCSGKKGNGRIRGDIERAAEDRVAFFLDEVGAGEYTVDGAG